jgi:hypothetical protein
MRNDAAPAVGSIPVEDQFADAVLRGGVEDWTQQGKAVTFAVDGVATRRERDVAVSSGSSFPDGVVFERGADHAAAKTRKERSR